MHVNATHITPGILTPFNDIVHAHNMHADIVYAHAIHARTVHARVMQAQYVSSVLKPSSR